jgi:hypothetical protein
MRFGLLSGFFRHEPQLSHPNPLVTLSTSFFEDIESPSLETQMPSKFFFQAL